MTMLRYKCVLALFALSSWLGSGLLHGQEADTGDEKSHVATLVSGLQVRGIGPAIASGRISDLIVHPERKQEWIATAASGGVWKTTNSGITWEPIFEGQGSYSIGCITRDPNNPQVLWLGTGENNSQRSVAYGDGVYKSVDGGKSWTNVGLEESEHIGRIVVDPRDSNVVYVAAQGPLWRAGGDRGLYKTTDGGDTWTQVLDVSENTGVNEVWLNPHNPDVLIASSYQRRRRTWTLINGGPESAIYRSTDAGETWDEITSGLPEADMGKIGLAVSPVDPDVVYAIVESIDDEGGVFRSADGGLNWDKRSDYVSGSPQYYNELIPDPVDPDVVYSNDTWLHVSRDGGTTWSKVPEIAKHVDNHALWIDPDDTDHLVAGCDGGVYETWDGGEAWHFKDNLPITQFYKIAVDNDAPFYNVYGGTQDNATLGGPSRTTSGHGITNRDWFVTVGGDGFNPVVDPENPDIVYSQWQYGNLVRYDRVSGELTDIKPQPSDTDAAPRWNWDSALAISPHSASRLYFASQRVYRSDDRGHSWQPISPDLTRSLDRNKLEVMGRVWGVDTVAKNRSTSPFGTVVSFAESPLVQGLLYAGTDDGLVQVSEDAGESWRRVDKFPGVPDMAYISDLEASVHHPDVVFVAIDNHKSGDFTPYLLRSDDRGRTWSSIAGDLPDRGEVLSFAEDHEDPELLFAGTEFGAWVSVTGGGEWHQIQGDLPVIAVRDLEIQRREDDLVLGTFGRGFYIVDDYSLLRSTSEEALAEPTLFAPRRSSMFMPTYELGFRDKAFQGAGFYAAPNPPAGAMLHYYLPESIRSLREQRREREKEEASPGYPNWNELREEDRAPESLMVLTVRDADGSVVRHLKGPLEQGLHRVTWDLRYAPVDPVSLEPPTTLPWSGPPLGPMVAPGEYGIQIGVLDHAGWQPIAPSQDLEVIAPVALTLPPEDRAAVAAFHKQVGSLQREVLAAERAIGEADDRIAHLRKAALLTPAPESVEWLQQLEVLETDLDELRVRLQGDQTVSSRSEPTPPSISDRIGRVVSMMWTSSSEPTETQREGYRIAKSEFAPVADGLEALTTGALAELEQELAAAGAPWTPGRLPRAVD